MPDTLRVFVPSSVVLDISKPLLPPAPLIVSPAVVAVRPPIYERDPAVKLNAPPLSVIVLRSTPPPLMLMTPVGLSVVVPPEPTVRVPLLFTLSVADPMVAPIVRTEPGVNATDEPRSVTVSTAEVVPLTTSMSRLPTFNDAPV